jgi:hypothetical protein
LELVDGLPGDPPRNFDSHTELVVVGTYLNQFDAELAKTALEAAGIDSTLRSTKSPHQAFTRGMDLLVRSEDAGEAQDILNVDATGGLKTMDSEESS